MAIHYITNQSVINFHVPFQVHQCPPDEARPSASAARRRARRTAGRGAGPVCRKGLCRHPRRRSGRPRGVSKGTLFLYFQSKEELFKAVIRRTSPGRFTEWNAEFDAFEGSSADMLRYCMNIWWERMGATKASGITKLIISESRNFPEVTAFTSREVIQPGQR
jgi:TetR/AcrR family transcriptional regulator